MMNVRTQLYAVLMSYVCAALLAIVAIVVSVSISEQNAAQTDQESNRKWCALLVSIDSGYQHTPPTTDAGRRFAKGIHQLRVDFDCE